MTASVPSPQPPPLPPAPERPLAPRVKALAVPFVARQGWVWAFCILGVLRLGVDVVRLDALNFMLDLGLVAGLGSLWRSLNRFKRAAAEGQPLDLVSAIGYLMRYVKVTVVVGVASFAILFVAIGVGLWWWHTHGAADVLTWLKAHAH